MVAGGRRGALFGWIDGVVRRVDNERHQQRFSPRKPRSTWSAVSHWESRPAGYRRIAAWWVVSAKRAETRERRLATLVDDCAAGRPIKSQRRAD